MIPDRAGALPPFHCTSLLAFGVTDILLRESEGVPAASAAPALDPSAALAAIAAEIGACTRCGLATTRTRTVPGQGNPSPRLLFVGEAPGAQEDASGLAFVGAAGQLLGKMIGAMGLDREQVFIANVLKCRPPQNRAPAPEEAAACTPFLWRQIEVLDPELIVALGGHAARNLLATEDSIRRLRGRHHDARGRRCIVTYHPSYLLQNPQYKRDAWEDLKFAMRTLGLSAPGASA